MTWRLLLFFSKELGVEIGKLKLTYGAFLTDIINFLIMAFVIFILVKVMNKIAKIGEKQEIAKNNRTK